MVYDTVKRQKKTLIKNSMDGSTDGWMDGQMDGPTQQGVESSVGNKKQP